MAQKVNSIEELEKLKADAATQGMQLPNYNEWLQVMNTLQTAGVESTGSYQGDVAKLREVETAVEEFIREAQIEKAAQDNKKENQQIQDLPKTDSEQTVKANMANATSSVILADYMKYYHLMK